MSSSFRKEPEENSNKNNNKTVRSILWEEDGLQMRYLQKSDFYKGYFELLSQLTKVSEVSYGQFAKRIDMMKRCGDMYNVVVIEDLALNKIIGTATLLVEMKFIRGCALVGHIEDVVVSSEYRGRNLGKRIIEQLQRIAQDRGCYKVILDCTEANSKFYEKMGFRVTELQMRYDVPPSSHLC